MDAFIATKGKNWFREKSSTKPTDVCVWGKQNVSIFMKNCVFSYHPMEMALSHVLNSGCIYSSGFSDTE